MMMKIIMIMIMMIIMIIVMMMIIMMIMMIMIMMVLLSNGSIVAQSGVVFSACLQMQVWEILC